MIPRALVLVVAAVLACLVIACSGGGSGGSANSTPASALRDRWPMLGHDLGSTFHSESSSITADNVSTLSEAWTLKASVYGMAALVGGKVYLLSNLGVLALEADSGAEVWRNASIRGTSSPAFDDGVLYVNDSGANLHALDFETGTERWHASVDDQPFASGFSSPIVAGDLVIVGSSSSQELTNPDETTFRGSIVAFDTNTGAEVWRHYTVDPPYNGVAVWSTVTVDIDAGRVFGSTGNNYTGEASDTSDSIFALELETGAMVWNRQLSEGDVFTATHREGPDADFGTNPLLFEATIGGASRKLVGAGQKSGVFWALDRETGEVVWSREVSGGSSLIGGVLNNGAFDGKRIIVAGNNGTSDAPGGEPSNGDSGDSDQLIGANVTTSVLMALDPADGSVLWERQLPAWVWAPITIADGVGFVSAERTFQAFDTATGAKLYELQTEGTIASGASMANRRVFFGSGLAYLTTTPGETFRALEVR